VSFASDVSPDHAILYRWQAEATWNHGLRKAFLKHLREREFDHLLFAHGAPWIGGARDGLRQFLERIER